MRTAPSELLGVLRAQTYPSRSGQCLRDPRAIHDPPLKHRTRRASLRVVRQVVARAFHETHGTTSQCQFRRYRTALALSIVQHHSSAQSESPLERPGRQRSGTAQRSSLGRLGEARLVAG